MKYLSILVPTQKFKPLSEIPRNTPVNREEHEPTFLSRLQIRQALNNAISKEFLNNRILEPSNHPGEISPEMISNEHNRAFNLSYWRGDVRNTLLRLSRKYNDSQIIDLLEQYNPDNPNDPLREGPYNPLFDIFGEDLVNIFREISEQFKKELETYNKIPEDKRPWKKPKF
jgi:hypothetical protein